MQFSPVSFHFQMFTQHPVYQLIIHLGRETKFRTRMKQAAVFQSSVAGDRQLLTCVLLLTPVRYAGCVLTCALCEGSADPWS